MKNILLTLMTENQNRKEKFEKLVEIIKTELGEEWQLIRIENYNKFEDSYKIELKSVYGGKDVIDANNFAIYMTDKIVSPWLVFFHKSENVIELIYNKSDNTQVRKIEFNVIKWGHLQIEE